MNLKGSGTPFCIYVVKYRLIKARWRITKSREIRYRCFEHTHIYREVFGATLADWNKEMNSHYN